MIGRIPRFWPILVVLALAGCGGGGTTPTVVTETVAPTVSTPTTIRPPAQTASLRVYFLRDGKVTPVRRTIEQTKAVATAALAALARGPETGEDVETAVPVDFRPTLSIDGGVAHAGDADLDRAGLAQVVYTLTQFPTVTSVDIGGKRYTRASFEQETPAILVESPLPGARVSTPLRVTGTANTFEATFMVEVVGADGAKLYDHFATATSGSGTRGTFDLKLGLRNAGQGPVTLVLYESSAEDGSRLHQVEVPLSLVP